MAKTRGGGGKKSAWHKKDLTSALDCALGGQTDFFLDGWGWLGQVDWGVPVCRFARASLSFFSYQGQGMRETRERPLLWLHVDTKKAGLPPPDCFALLFGD